MGGMCFGPETLGDGLSETVGYKSGIALSIEAMCDLLADTQYADVIMASETQYVRIRSEEYDELFYKLLHRIGYTEKEYNGDIVGIDLYHKYKKTPLKHVHEGVIKLFNETFPLIMQEAQEKGSKSLNPELFMRAAAQKYGKAGLDMAFERLEVLDKAFNISPHTGQRYTEWRNIETLESLFAGGSGSPEFGKFLDQRFINYLHANNNRIQDMHWRKFEELTAEFFHRDGYNVELGPGRNDDGVYVRVWKPEQSVDVEPPHIIIQCKRQKKKIEKVVVKGLYADMKYNDAEYGLIVTSNELSPGAKQTIIARGYSIQEVDNSEVRNWLKELQVPGAGIVRV